MCEGIGNFTFPMSLPNSDRLAAVLRRGLVSNFAESTVEWVDCPDLTQAPFNLAAPGLCGNTAILQVGGTGHMFPHRIPFDIPFTDFSRVIGRNTCDSFIIGGCILRRPPAARHGELTANVSSRRKVNTVCKSRVVYTTLYGREAVDLSSLYDLRCSMMGNFYISEGISGPVLKVYAKKRIGLEFIDAMQHALSEAYPGGYLAKDLVGLGGVFIANNGQIRHRLIPRTWGKISNKSEFREKLHKFVIPTPVVGVGMFLNTNEFILKHEQGYDTSTPNPFQFTKKQFNTFSGGIDGGCYVGDVESVDTLEYLGYFHPASVMLRIAPSVDTNVPDLEL